MIIFPAVDLYQGKAVRLYQGDYNLKTDYSDDPVSVAKTFRASGATHIHTVDLEGAKTGGTPNFDLICRIKKESGLFTEVGGGIRDLQTVEKYISAGVDRVILGTAAAENPEFVAQAVNRYGDKIAVGADVKNGFIAVRGWTEKSDKDLYSFCEEMRLAGVKTVICTDISKDGAMRGANAELYKTLSQKVDLNIVASGGVSSLKDIKELKEIGLYGAIIGKAYYTGAIDLKSAIEAAK